MRHIISSDYTVAIAISLSQSGGKILRGYFENRPIYILQDLSKCHCVDFTLLTES